MSTVPCRRPEAKASEAGCESTHIPGWKSASVQSSMGFSLSLRWRGAFPLLIVSYCTPLLGVGKPRIMGGYEVLPITLTVIGHIYTVTTTATPSFLYTA